MLVNVLLIACRIVEAASERGNISCRRGLGLGLATRHQIMMLDARVEEKVFNPPVIDADITGSWDMLIARCLDR